MRICLNELSNYNSGTLVSKWFNLNDYTSADDFHAAVNDWLNSCPNPDGGKCEEFNIADYEELPKYFFSQYFFDAETFYKFNDLTDEEKIAYQYLVEMKGFCVDEAFDSISDITVSDQDIDEYVYDLVVDMGVSDFALRYFDFEKYQEDLEYEGYLDQYGDYLIIGYN